MIVDQRPRAMLSRPVEVSPDMGRALARCADITRSRARNFYYGLRLTPEPRRSALYALYAWMRAGDDTVDDAPTPEAAAAAFMTFRERSEAVIEGRPVTDVEDDACWRALAYAIQHWQLPQEPLYAMLDGLGEDLTPAAYATEADVDRYCERVGASVGVLCVHVWGLRPSADRKLAMELATKRGIAFQRTNILRDIGEDAAANPPRCYIATDTLDRFELTPTSLASWSAPSACRSLVSNLASRARTLYRESSRLESMIAPDCVPVLSAMTRIYSGVLSCVERSPARAVRGPRASLSTPRKIAIAGRACLASLSARL